MPIRVLLKTITPIHIGTGRNIAPEDYYYFNGKAYRLNIDNCLQYVKNKIGKENFFKNFDEWINKVSLETEISAGSKARKDLGLSIFDFIRNQLKDQDFLKRFESEIPNNRELYHYYIDSFKAPTKEVKEQIKTANNLPFIPGSSFKGLLRNCLLNYVLNSNIDNYSSFLIKNISNRINKINSEILKAKRENKNVNLQRLKFDDDKPIENEIFCCKHLNNKGKETFDAKYDLFKFIQVSDFYPNNPDCLRIVEVFNLTTKGNPQALLTLETVTEGTEFEGTITLKVDELKELHKHLQKVKKQNEWLGIEDKFPNVFGIPFNSLEHDASSLEKIFTNRIKEAIEDFSSAIINKDLGWLEKNNYNQKPILEYFYNILPENALKIGFSSGFHTVTIFDVLANVENNPNLTSKYFELLSILKIIKNKNLDFPKHRKIVKLLQNREATFGWISVDFIQS